MTTTPPDLERKVNQLDNDVQSIYEMLTGIEGTQRRHGNRLQELSEQLGRTDAKVDALGSRIDGLESRIGGLESRIDGLSSRIDGLESKIDEVLGVLRERLG